MKSVLIFVLLGFNLCLLQAQSEQTLFKKSRVRGGFGGPSFSYSKVKGHEGYGAGGGGGVVFQNLFLGAYGSGEVKTPLPDRGRTESPASIWRRSGRETVGGDPRKHSRAPTGTRPA